MSRRVQIVAPNLWHVFFEQLYLHTHTPVCVVVVVALRYLMFWAEKLRALLYPEGTGRGDHVGDLIIVPISSPILATHRPSPIAHCS